ncbi:MULTISPECIES: type II toxin-antitoxin system RelE/ParE family toxin [Thiorhodovibrio]|uniref:type II toxin-antitoxin system RelE/ParE family toxin n=1 Tax=Thiorhodovibrio TaxID=61593 RepID=UPI001F5D5666|nr:MULTISPECIES: type II toxin-antitoxin system RelE/ParE family toxin [Thiorhodovibrio]WPL10808.1 Plasmid stabilization system protein [Thiorhodovibrio litoralis]
MAKPVIRRERSSKDLEEAADFHFAQGGEALELRFIDAIERTLQLIAERPAIGSLRYAHPLQRSGLRCFQVRRFPYVVFYVDLPDRVDVLRVLHRRRDIPAILQSDRGDGAP